MTSSSSSRSWHDRRTLGLDEMYRQGVLTDVVLTAVDEQGKESQFAAHRVLLAAHSDYFHHLFTSGMREAAEGVVRFPEVDPPVLASILEYIYTCQLPDLSSFAFFRSLVLTANMWQMSDLEMATLSAAAAQCTPGRVLKLYLFMLEAKDVLTGASVSSAARQEIEATLMRVIRDRWSVIVSPEKYLKEEKADDHCLDDGSYSLGLVDLDIQGLQSLLQIKSEQEVVKLV